MNCGTYYREMDVSYDEFADSLEKVYAYLKQNDRINKEDCRYEIGVYSGSKGDAYKQMLIPMEECIDCGSIYFHNPKDCGIDEGEGYSGGDEAEWICSSCLRKREEANIMPFDTDRKKLREQKKNELINSGVIMEEQDRCCVCLDELIICEVEDHDSRIDENRKLVCNHILCGKCYFDMKKIEEGNMCCPLCRTELA